MKPDESPESERPIPIADYDYALPPDRIAREPARPRDASRLLVIDRRTGAWTDSRFLDLASHLGRGDLLVMNDTRVLKARLFGMLERTGRDVELLFAGPTDGNEWEAMLRPGRRVRTGDRIAVDGAARFEVGERRDYGLRAIRPAEGALTIEEALERHGHVPLPPYIDRADTAADARDYQTVFARRAGAVAAPTAGLHFTDRVLSILADRGVATTTITLHVGVGTFMPVRTEDASRHRLKPERFEVSPEAAEALNAARAEGRRVIAVGTTATRTLEYALGPDGRFAPGRGETDLYITPGYRFRAIDGLLTNFHLPRSTLLLLVAAFLSRERILAAYRHSVDAGYRFYSYGDCTLIL